MLFSTDFQLFIEDAKMKCFALFNYENEDKQKNIRAVIKSKVKKIMQYYATHRLLFQLKNNKKQTKRYYVVTFSYKQNKNQKEIQLNKKQIDG